MSVIRAPREPQVAPDRARRIIANEARIKACAYLTGGLARITASIADPIEQFRFIAEVHDAETLIEAVKIISRRDNELRKRRRPVPREQDDDRDAGQPAGSLGWL